MKFIQGSSCSSGRVQLSGEEVEEEVEEELCWEIQTRDRNTEKQLTAKLHHVKSQGTFLSLFPGSRAVLLFNVSL